MIRMGVLEARRSVQSPVLAIPECSSSLARSTFSPRVQFEVVMYTRRWLLVGLLAAGLLTAQEGQPTVQVAGAVKQPLTLSAGDLAKMPRASVRTMNNGVETIYEGVWLHEVLKRAGVPQGG